MEQSADKYMWLNYFADHKNIGELTRAAAVELVDKIRVIDKNHIEVKLCFEDCYKTIIERLRIMGYEVENADGRLVIQKKEVG